MLKNVKCLFSGQHLKQRTSVFVSITKIVSDFYIKLIIIIVHITTVFRMHYTLPQCILQKKETEKSLMRLQSI